MDTPDAPPVSDERLLLRCYVRDGSEAAFRALAERYLPLVWSVARRVVNGDAALAEDVAQMVLADFAAKAHTFSPDMPAAGWLHRHTVFTACKAVRGEVRRRAREQAVALPQSVAPDFMNADSDKWEEIAPHLDGALDRLREADRAAIVLRFFENRSLREVGRLLGISEEAARKRVDRAVDKLRGCLGRRVAVPALAVLVLLLRDQSVAAPSGMVSRKILSGAWSRLESGAIAATPSLPWWRRRAVLAGTVAVLLAGWLSLMGGSGANGDRDALRHPEPGKASAARGAPAADPVASGLTLTVTVMMVPEAIAAQRMADYEPGKDAILFRDLRPRAEAMQKLLKSDHPDDVSATAGQALVVLSKQFAAAPASLRMLRTAKVSYPTEFAYDRNTGTVKPAEPIDRLVGTTVDANVVPVKDGLYSVKCTIHDHAWALPEQEWFEYRRQSDPPGGPTAVAQPVFHSSRWELSAVSLAVSETVLAGMSSLPSRGGAAAPDSGRLFVFLQLQP